MVFFIHRAGLSFYSFLYPEHSGNFRNNLTLSSKQSFSEDFRQYSICLSKGFSLFTLQKCKKRR